MSAPEGFYVLQSENKPVGDKPRIEKTTKGSLGGTARKRLGDISNLPQQPKPLIKVEKEHRESGTTKEEIGHLRKENVMLTKRLVEKNKIIELCGIEVQKLRAHVQKLQQQNSQFAQSNSQMLMELNSGKERVRILQHELGCANCLLKAKRVILEEKATGTGDKVDSQEGTSRSEEARESVEVDRGQKEPYTTKRKQQSKSLASSAAELVQLNEETENTRVLRRRSARFKYDEPMPTEDTVETNDAKAPLNSLHSEQIQEEASTSISSSVGHDAKETNLLQPETTCIQFLEEKATIETCHEIDSQEGTSRSEEARESVEVDRGRKKPCTTKRKQQSKSLGLSAAELDQLNEKTENTRVSRRQSARFKSEEPMLTEDAFETNDAKAPLNSLLNEQIQEESSTSISSKVGHDTKETNHLQGVEQMQEECPTSTSSSVRNDEKENNERPSVGAEVIGRTSLRPSRQATKKVQSYKEIPLNIKMRRPE